MQRTVSECSPGFSLIRFHDTEVVVVGGDGGVVSGMRACVHVSVYVPWILQQAHLVAMCQCHWPLCSPSGWYTHSARNDSCSIRGPSRTTDTQTFPHTQSMTHNQNANSSAQSNKRIVVHTRNVHPGWKFQYSIKLCIFETYFLCYLFTLKLHSIQIFFLMQIEKSVSTMFYFTVWGKENLPGKCCALHR